MDLLTDAARLIYKHTPEIFIGAVGYNLRKYFGEHLTKYVFNPILKWLKSLLVRTERETAIWIHHKNRRDKTGHKHRSPIECEDGQCRII